MKNLPMSFMNKFEAFCDSSYTISLTIAARSSPLIPTVVTNTRRTTNIFTNFGPLCWNFTKIDYVITTMMWGG